MEEDLFWMPGHRLRDLFAQRSISPLEFAYATLERIDQLNTTYNAFITVDHDDVIAQARRAEDALNCVDRLGPLHGVPISVKDSVATAGLRTAYASLAFEDLLPQEDAIPVARLRAAGAIILGKTNTSEFALLGRTRNKLTPETINPWHPEASAGGSSGGAAASTALGLNPAAIGGDDGGSIRLPAAICGVFGFCPSAGRVPHLTLPREGGFISQLFQRTGPLSRDVVDAALVTGIMSGHHESDPFALRTTMRSAFDRRPVRGLRALWISHSGAADNPSVISHVRDAAAKLEDLEIRVEDDGTVIDLPFEALSIVMRAHLTKHLRQLAVDPERWSMLTPGSLQLVEQCENHRITPAEEFAAWRSRRALEARYAGLFEKFDILLTPTFGDIAPEVVDGWEPLVPVTQWAASTYGINAAGLSAASVPCGFVNDMPVGLQVIAPAGRDDLVLDVSRAIEQHWPWVERRPPYVM